MGLVCTDHTLLIPAFALLAAPRVLTVPLLSRCQNAPLPSHPEMGFRASGADLILVGLSVPPHSTSELLRTLEMMAASEPTSWLFEHEDGLAN